MTDLPTGWVQAKLAEVCDIEMGQAPPSSTYNISSSGLPFLQGKSDFGNLYPTPKKFCAIPQKIAKSGAVLLSVQAPVGPTNIACQDYCIGRGLAAITSLGCISNRFIMWALRSYEPTLAKLATGSTFSAITKTQVLSIPIKLPTINEQQRILQIIDSHFEAAEKLNAEIDAALVHAEKLRQSILKKAFAGQLISQDPNDEPAAVLLARIQAERPSDGNKSHKQKRSI
ncbi:restriction endonuclease subunit S [Candidatus Poriferisocius sp.]|uniref:restriction endonuclease subunit S n=1 Tax=Candidatus Poriferisocius sp. TaxID=3101276 RepID=UPI003B0173B9